VRSKWNILLVWAALAWSPIDSMAQALVLCIGDSITEGVYVSVPYPTRLRNNTGHVTINAGIGGERANTGLTRIDALLALHNPSHVLILFGTNDILSPSQDLRSSANAVRQMALRARAYGAIPIVGTATPMFPPRAFNQPRVQTFNAYVRADASANGYRVADLESAFGSNAGLVISDGFHPTDSGMEVIARTFAPHIGAQAYLALGAQSAAAADVGESGKTLSVVSSGAWSASSSQPWLAIASGASGNRNGTIVYNVQANTLAAARSASIVVVGSGVSRTFTVTQAALDVYSPWEAGFTPLSYGWRRLANFGDYVRLGSDGWLWHQEHGYIFIPADTPPESMWMFMGDLGWNWTARDLYPFLYSADLDAWLWYSGQTNPRWFYDMTRAEWFYVP
jgi:acyl-CoA thioesterase I